VAIVGRPNVGKSTLFNRIILARSAIVEREPGVTRDRLYSDAEWSGREFTLVDTGGLEAAPDAFSEKVQEQAEAAIKEADVIIFVVDARSGALPDDDVVAQQLRRAGKPVVLAANKAETEALRQGAQEFFRFGLGRPYAVSAAHGIGTGDMLDAVAALLPGEPARAAGEEGQLVTPLAVIGRPNVGKSSLINAVVGSQRLITSEVPGTTRDAIDVRFEYEGQSLVFTDTAGLRRPSRVEPGLERWSAMRALRAVGRSEVVLLVIDATQEIAEQERRMVGYSAEAGRGLVLVLNKIDLLDRPAGELARLQDKVRNELYFVPWAPLVAVSAKTGEHLGRLLRTATRVASARRQRIPMAEIEGIVSDACLLRPPGSFKGRPIRCRGAEQLPGLPPAFAVYFNWPQAVEGSYLRFIENRLREGYDFTGSPLRVIARKRG
jgi:GTP-binding protein